VLLTNDETFAAKLEAAVNQQHAGMLTRASLPLPGSIEKETIVRVNTNRLNSISYWYCLDRAGPTEKASVYTALSGAATFPDSFAAVDAAIKSSVRKGRRAQSCVLTLIVFARNVDLQVVDQLGNVWRTEVKHGWLQIAYLDEGWAKGAVPEKDAGLLESEWTLRVVILGDEFVAHLISGDAAKERKCLDVLERLRNAIKAGTWTTTLQQTEKDWVALVDAWSAPATSSTASFWAMGARRSAQYEVILERLLGAYNVGGGGFLSYRPDVVVEPFAPCSILSAASPAIDDINNAIKRLAHVFEFTAMETLSVDGVRTYLKQKLPNYVEVTREQ
jgi:hypothetical protein